jgi:hypothetical protein
MGESAKSAAAALQKALEGAVWATDEGTAWASSSSATDEGTALASSDAAQDIFDELAKLRASLLQKAPLTPPLPPPCRSNAQTASADEEAVEEPAADAARPWKWSRASWSPDVFPDATAPWTAADEEAVEEPAADAAQRFADKSSDAAADPSADADRNAETLKKAREYEFYNKRNRTKVRGGRNPAWFWAQLKAE